MNVIFMHKPPTVLHYIVVVLKQDQLFCYISKNQNTERLYTGLLCATV